MLPRSSRSRLLPTRDPHAILTQARPRIAGAVRLSVWSELGASPRRSRIAWMVAEVMMAVKRPQSSVAAPSTRRGCALTL